MTDHKFCAECGSSLNPGAAFCDQCGVLARSSAKTSVEAASVLPKKQSSNLIIVVLIVVSVFILGIAALGAGGWFLLRAGKTTTQTTIQSGSDTPAVAPPEESPVVTRIPEELRFEDFESANIDINGDGSFDLDPTNPANAVWRLFGDADLGFFLPLPSIGGGSDIHVTYDVFIPSQTVIMSIEGQESPVVLVRTRLMDSDGNSALAGDTLPPSGQWQTVSTTFEDPEAGVFEVGIEALWFEGPIYIDNVSAKSAVAP